ncbi:hypothetical protein KAJ38_01355 [Candidatus Pacearchaeota archaeon]|nr:hypothetical protein [Candidatus Pacearchaeota archaeon]
MGWKNLPTWLKGGIIGFVIPIFVLILSYSNPPIWIQGLLMLLATLVLLPVLPFLPRFPYLSQGEWFWGYLSGVILWTLIGMLVGFIIDKRRKRKLEQAESVQRSK